MEHKTKVGVLGGSLKTSIPVNIVKLLEIEKGDNLIWLVDIKDDTVKIELKKQED